MSTPKTNENPWPPLAGAIGSATCEVVQYRLRKILGPGGKREYSKCGNPAWYFWTPRGKPNPAMIVCKECGEALAGNFTDELTRYAPNNKLTGGADGR